MVKKYKFEPRRLISRPVGLKSFRGFFIAAGKGNTVAKEYTFSCKNTCICMLILFVAIAFIPSRSSAYRPFITEDIYIYGMAFDYSFVRRLHICSETVGNSNPDKEEDRNPLSSLAGLMYELSDKVILDSGIRYGLNDSVPKRDVLMGISITF